MASYIPILPDELHSRIDMLLSVPLTDGGGRAVSLKRRIGERARFFV